MAKENKKQETATVAATSEENVMDVIKTGNLLKESNVAAALAEISWVGKKRWLKRDDLYCTIQ